MKFLRQYPELFITAAGFVLVGVGLWNTAGWGIALTASGAIIMALALIGVNKG